MQTQTQTQSIQRKAVYTIPEIASMAGISRNRTERLLRAGGVEMIRVGRRYVVALASIQQAMPDLWESLLQASCPVGDFAQD